MGPRTQIRHHDEWLTRIARGLEQGGTTPEGYAPPPAPEKPDPMLDADTKNFVVQRLGGVPPYLLEPSENTETPTTSSLEFTADPALTRKVKIHNLGNYVVVELDLQSAKGGSAKAIIVHSTDAGVNEWNISRPTISFTKPSEHNPMAYGRTALTLARKVFSVSSFPKPPDQLLG